MDKIYAGVKQQDSDKKIFEITAKIYQEFWKV